jgi:glyoxylase-like metal-dependent hydrolase (beta-lactamase superfamily II)
MSTDDTYEVYALHYGHHDRPASENFIGGDPHDVPMPLDYYVWVIRNASRTFVLDTGFNERSAAQRNREMVHPVGEGLRALGIDPDKVEDVILSHLHYDHAGNIPLFPRARFHLQDREMTFATGRCMCHAVLRHSFDADDVTTLVHRLYQERVAFHDGTSELAPGITLHLIGGHSNGLQSVRVKTRRGYVVLAADAAHFYAHLQQRRIFPTVYNVGDVLEGYDKVEALASSKRHVVPGHDPLVLEIYPAASPNMQGWAVRLDADPKELPPS